MNRKTSKPTSPSAEIDKLLSQFFAQARAQFGSAIKSYWFYDGGLCPGCSQPSDGVMKFKGEKALSLNAFIYRAEGVLIGYFLCKHCARQIFEASEKNPYRQIPLHTQIEQHLIAAYQHYHRKHEA